MNAHVDELRALEREMRTISMVAGQCSIEGAEDAISLLAAAEAERTSRWADRLQAVARELERLTIARAAPPGADYVSLLHEAKRRVEASPLYRRFIAHTPLSNDVAVWMADLAHDAHDAVARAAQARTLQRCAEEIENSLRTPIVTDRALLQNCVAWYRAQANMLANLPARIFGLGEERPQEQWKERQS